ncbi:beta-ketoacyl synthase N-terminal-like domain-containing protein, partial [Nocardiopsis gilva]
MGAVTYEFGDQAVAVIGVGCRLPGGIHDLDTLWTALDEGRDLVSQVPADRFEVARFVDEAMPRVGRSYTAAGAFLDDIACFDAEYFGISPKEAAQMDPQHRLLLEMTAEALDDAAIDPDHIAGTDTGVFVGISDSSYGGLQMSSPQTINAYTASGGAHSIAANRLSYAFDLRGPSMAVDTACSSSLTALERACQRVGCDGGMAVAGGVNILLSPSIYVAFSQASMLSRKGRCAAFSADADGFVRAEGGGVVVLKRLAEARADGDRIHGVLLGWGANSDGRTMGMALPNTEAQEDLLRTVYARAGVTPDDLVYVEAHGTGTIVGDPAECRSIGRVLGRHRSGPLPIGSIKSNMGHLEPASGMAGLFKALLVLRHGHIPASLHATPLNSDIDFPGLGLAPAVEPSDVEPLATERRLAGVNSFGFGGANAHVIVAGPPADAATAHQEGPVDIPTTVGRGDTEPAGNVDVDTMLDADRPDAAPGAVGAPDGMPDTSLRRPVVVSARTPDALARAAEAMAARVDAAGAQEFYDIAYTSSVRRGKHPYRSVVLARDGAEAAERLRNAPVADAPAADGRVAFVYSGNGAQWVGMGADLLASDSVFAAGMAEADTELAPHLGWSVVEELALPPDEWRLDRTEVAQPLLFAVQVGLTRLLAAHGIRPAAAIGHSVGETSAAWAAGMLSLGQAARIVAARSAAQAPTAGSGRMLAVDLSPQDAGELTERHPDVEIAGINSDHDLTLVGPDEQITAVADELDRRGVFTRRLDLNYGFHSAAMDPVRDPLLQALDGLSPEPGDIPLASTITGDLIEGTELTPDHWWRGVRDPVLFAAAAQRLRASGIEVFAEIGPHPILLPYLRRLFDASPQRRPSLTATLRRDTDGGEAVDTAVTSLIAAGADIDWSAFFPRAGRVVDLPAYPWQRERHWNGAPHDWAPPPPSPIDHPLLGARLPAAISSWEGPVEPAMAPWIADHKLAGSVVFPAVGYIEMALSAGRLALGYPVEAHAWEFTQPLVISWPDATAMRVQTSVSPDDGITHITSFDESGKEPRAHARGRVRRLLGQAPAPVDVAGVRGRCSRHVGGTEHYEWLDSLGLQYGPGFQVLQDLWAGEGEVLAAYRTDDLDNRLLVHPAVLDGALQSVIPLAELLLEEGDIFLPAAVGAVKAWRAPTGQGWIWARDRTRVPHELCWDITVTDANGAVTAELYGVRERRLAVQQRRPLTVQRTVMRAAPHLDQPAAASPLPPPDRIAAHAAPRIDEVRRAWGAQDYARFTERFPTLGTRLLAKTRLAMAPEAADRVDWEDTVSRAPDHLARFQETMLRLLRSADLLEPVPGGGYRIPARALSDPHTGRDVVSDLPSFTNEMALILHQLCRLPELVRAERDPLEMLAEESTGELVRQFYAASPHMRFSQRVARALLQQIVAEWPTDRPLRVLEVGAGTGGLTQALLPLFPPERTRYTFTDISPFFLTAADKYLAAYDFVDYRVLDLNTDPADQGFTVGGYDIVLAANALHTASDMAVAVPRVASLLAAGGYLLATEFHNNALGAAMFGILESFWDAADTDLRPDGRFLARDQWPELLRRCGFENVVQTGSEDAPAREDFSIILASTPAETTVAPVGAPLTTATGEATSEADADTCHHLLVAESEAELHLARAVAELDEAQGDGSRVVAATAEDEAWTDLPAGQDTNTSITLILGEPDPGEDCVQRATQRAALLRRLVTGLSPDNPTPLRRLVLVTRPSGALPAPEKPDVPADAAVWGMTRSLANECPDLPITCISLERVGDTAVDARRLAAELAAESTENEIALTRGGRFVPRETGDPSLVPEAEIDAYSLNVRDIGLSYRTEWVEADIPEPAPGMVCIEVRAAALNYRDIMQATGLLPAEAVEGTFTEQGLGLECAGIITAVGDGVEDMKAGDRVLAVAPRSLASHTQTAAHAVGRIPDHMTFAEAATTPVAFTTVQYALGDLARLGPGETVLVHGAAGGVGLAALHYARHRGARVIATAGSEIKRDFLRVLGVEDVLDSRDLDFVPRVMESTGGRGVDVVLNSLAGEAIGRGLDLLKPGGRFIELGKRDIMADGSLPLRPFHNNLTFCGVDLNALLNRPDIARRVWSEVVEGLNEGRFRPLPHTTYPAAQVREAFALLQHSRHIGKVIVTFDDQGLPTPVRPCPPAPPR